MVATETKAKPGFHYAWLIFISCCFMMAGGLGGVLDASLGVFLKPVTDDLEVSRAEYMFFLTVYFVTTIAAMPIVGYVLPRFNIRIVLSVTMGMTVLALGLNGMYTEIWMWYISGFVYGLAGSFIFVIPVPILIGNWFFKRKGVMLGIAMCFSGIGGMVLAPLFTFFINTFEWRMAYVISAIVLAVMVLPWTMFVLRFKPEDMGLKPYGWSEEAEREQALRNKKTFLASSSGVPASGKILLTVPFISMFLLCGLVSFYASVGTQMAPFGTELGLFGTPEANAMFGATIVSAVMIGNMGSKVIMGFVTDIIGVHRAMLIQLVLVVIGLLGFVFFATSPWIIYVWAVLFGVQNSIYAVSTPLLIRSIFGEKNFTQIFTWARVGTGVIGAIGSTIIGYLFDIFHGYDAVFLVGVAIAVVCIACVVSAELTKKSLPWEEGTPVAPEGAD